MVVNNFTYVYSMGVKIICKTFTSDKHTLDIFIFLVQLVKVCLKRYKNGNFLKHYKLTRLFLKSSLYENNLVKEVSRMIKNYFIRESGFKDLSELEAQLSSSSINTDPLYFEPIYSNLGCTS